MTIIYETINHYNKDHNILPWKYIGSDESIIQVISLKRWCEENSLPYNKVWKNEHPMYTVKKISIGEKNVL